MTDPHRSGGVSPRTLVAFLAGFLLLGVVIAGVVALLDGATATAPSPGAATTTAPAPEATHTTAPPADGGAAAETPAGEPPPPFGEITEQVADIRGLDALQPVDAQVLAPEDLSDRLLELISTELDADELALDQRLLAVLGMIEPDVDLVAAVEELYTTQILGVYVPDDQRLYVRAAGDDLTPGERATAAHEVLHALQDQHHDLGRLRDIAEEEPDAALAFQAVIEGDALLVEQSWAAAHLDDDERQAALVEALTRSGDVPEVPPYLLATLAFPYERGAPFVATLVESGGFAAVDSALADPPTTTAEIYHPQRYLDGVEERAVDVPDAGADWEELREVSFGEFDLRQMLTELDAEVVTEAATGWAGGRLRGFGRGSETAIGLALAFDDDAEAAEACDAMASWLELGLVEGIAELTCAGALVRLGAAPDATTAAALASG